MDYTKINYRKVSGKPLKYLAINQHTPVSCMSQRGSLKGNFKNICTKWKRKRPIKIYGMQQEQCLGGKV